MIFIKIEYESHVIKENERGNADRLNKVASRIKDLIQKENLWTGQVIRVITLRNRNIVSRNREKYH